MTVRLTIEVTLSDTAHATFKQTLEADSTDVLMRIESLLADALNSQWPDLKVELVDENIDWEADEDAAP